MNHLIYFAMLALTLLLSSCSFFSRSDLHPGVILNADPPPPGANGAGTLGMSGQGGDETSPANPIQASSSSSIAGFQPGDLRTLYRIQQQPYTGKGVKVCLVEAYDIGSFATQSGQEYAATFTLPAPTIHIDNPNGAPPPDPNNWHVEAALDVEMVEAVAPNAEIHIIQALSASSDDMTAAVAAAPGLGCSIVSMSYSGGPGPNELQDESVYEQPGIAFFASSGDVSGALGYPALQPGVIAVGGTSVQVDSQSNVIESVWNHSPKATDGEGAGLDFLFPFPNYQHGFNPTASKQAPEVAAVADPVTGVAVDAGGKWGVAGGTSAAAPIWAAVFALVFEGRRAKSLPDILDAHRAIYAGLSTVSSTAFRDVTRGAAGLNDEFPSAAGYDAATGFGTPLADGIVSYLTAADALGTD